MTGAILKVEYKKPNDKSVGLVICGNFFFIDRQTIVTCQHVLDKENLKPLSPYRHYQLFLLFQNQQYELTDEKLYEFTHIDTVIVRLKKKFKVEVAHLNKNARMADEGLKLESASYENDGRAKIPFDWKDDRVALGKYEIEGLLKKRKGTLVERDTLNYYQLKNPPKGIRYEDAKAFLLSWSAMEGVSGSAVFLCGTNTILGMVTGGPGDERNAKKIKFPYAIASFQIYSAALRNGLIKPRWKFWK